MTLFVQLLIPFGTKNIYIKLHQDIKQTKVTTYYRLS